MSVLQNLEVCLFPELFGRTFMEVFVPGASRRMKEERLRAAKRCSNTSALRGTPTNSPPTSPTATKSSSRSRAPRCCAPGCYARRAGRGPQSQRDGQTEAEATRAGAARSHHDHRRARHEPRDVAVRSHLRPSPGQAPVRGDASGGAGQPCRAGGLSWQSGRDHEIREAARNRANRVRIRADTDIERRRSGAA